MYSVNTGLPHAIEPGTKVLFANFPADGHFNPLTGLAVHLKSIGCDVRWYTSKKYAAKLQRLDIPHYALNRALDFGSGTPEEIFPEREKIHSQVKKLVFDMIHAFILRGPEYFEDIREIKEEFDFDVLVADVAFTGSVLVKEKLKIPVISIGVLPLTETSIDLPPAGLGMTPSSTTFGKMKQAVLRFIADRFLFGKPNQVMRDVMGAYGIETEGYNLFDLNVKKSNLFLQSGTQGFEYERSDLGKNIRFVGPLLPYLGKKGGKPWYNEKIRQYQKVILITQGTVERDINKLVIPALEAFKNTEYLLIVTTGGANTTELRDQYPQDNIIIEDFIPFEDVMPYCDVYISNGGYGGVLLSIQNQLPMVVAGKHEGKNEINARVGYFKLGINLKTETPTVQQLKKSVEEVLNSETYLANVKALRAEFKRYNSKDLFVGYLADVINDKQRTERKYKMKMEAIY